MDQFTFYDLYYETFNGLKDEEIGRFIKRICNYALYDLEDEVSKFLDGFKMIYGNLNSTLQGYEVVAMDIINKPFDPDMMEAVLTEEVAGVEPNTVVDVLQKGYTYKGKVIRYAMVKVSK